MARSRRCALRWSNAASTVSSDSALGASTNLVSAAATAAWRAAWPAGSQSLAVARAGLTADITERFAAGLPVRPGVPALLGALSAAGVPLAVVSSSYRSLVEAARF